MYDKSQLAVFYLYKAVKFRYYEKATKYFKNPHFFRLLTYPSISPKRFWTFQIVWIGRNHFGQVQIVLVGPK